MIDLEIREQLARYVSGEMDAPTLEDWLQDVCWDAPADPAESLAVTSLRLLAERANGDWTDAELRDRLGALSRTYWLEQAPRVVYANSDAHVIREDRRSASVDRWRVVESV
jgi:hypothetical protein